MSKKMWPSIDHGILSPSGHVSKRSRKLALERMRRELFGDGLPFPIYPQPLRSVALRRTAANLRELAARGMSPRKYAREAAKFEAEAEILEREGETKRARKTP